jgi:hypothetical protein
VSNGFIVGSIQMIPEAITCMRWGGFKKDIKGRNTKSY